MPLRHYSDEQLRAELDLRRVRQETINLVVVGRQFVVGEEIIIEDVYIEVYDEQTG